MTERRIHHPTYEECMALEKAAARMTTLARKHLPVERSMLRDSIKVVDGGPITAGFFYDYDMLVEQIAEITGRDRKRDHKPHRGCLGAACPVMPERTSIVRTGEVIWEVIREPAEPKGPLALRLRLWWMRRRLWWMRARLDGQPVEALWQSVVPATLGSMAMSALIDALDGPSVWWSLPIAPVLAWCFTGGWRTPTVDAAIRKAP